MTWYFAIGVLSGLGSGLFGIGGGAIRIPLLALSGMPMIQAYGINLFIIPFSSVTGAWSHRRNIQWQFAPWVVLGGALGSLAGAALTGLFQPLVLALIFVAAAVLSVAGIYANSVLPRLAKKMPVSKPTLVFGAFILNVITGMRGGSGGTLFPAFLHMFKLDMHQAIATSLFVQMFTASAGVFIYWSRGQIDWRHAAIITAGAVIGTRLGAKMGLRLKSVWLEAGLSVVIIALAVLTLFRAQ